MTSAANHRYGDVLEFDRLLNVYFYTSNTDKILQARLVFARNGYQLLHFRSNREPYGEDYSLGTEALLAKAIQQVNAQFKIKSIFFVEDTSLRIAALSDAADYPGPRVKEWFSEISFEELNQQIQLRGGNREVVVRSDIALHVPTLSRPLYFHGETRGQIASSAPIFEPSPQYPWLTPNTFNGWFIPEGASKRLGEMEFEESLTFDFRVKSLMALIDRLEELNAALNIPSTFYKVATRHIHAVSQQPLLTGLLPKEKLTEVLLVVGNKCAGKTTLSDYLASREGVVAVEASKVLRSLAWEAEETIDTAIGAVEFLEKHGMDCVAKKIAEYVDMRKGVLNVITGLRTVEELYLLKMHFPQAKLVLVSSDVRIRFERHIRRARDPDVKAFADFIAQDEIQATFGVMRVANEIATDVIANDASISQFEKKLMNCWTEATAIAVVAVQ
jgi:inosine/xanthosine triphosphate pyrophosphatase family protein/dephospho-CoA kinase